MMQKMKNLQQATDYVYERLKEVNAEIQKDDVFDTILDEVMESAEFMMTDDDDRFLEDNEKDLTAIEEYLERKIPGYQDLLTEIVADMVGEEITE